MEIFNPDKYELPKTGRNVVFSLRIDEAVYEKLRQLAKLEGRSMNAQMLRFIESGLWSEVVNNYEHLR